MADITIGRLSLKLSGLSGDQGQRLARLIADGLTKKSMAIGSSRRLETMQVAITARLGTDLDILAYQIVSEMLRQLEQTI